MRGLPVEFHKEKNFGVETDFNHLTVATAEDEEGFTHLHTVGAIVIGDAFGGIATLTWTAADNETLAIYTPNEIFEFVRAKPIRFVALGVLPIVLGDELNLYVGCMEDLIDAVPSTAMQDAGAGPRADSDMFGFFTPEAGGAVFPLTEDYWHAVSSFGALQTITPLIATDPNNLSGIDWKAWDGAAGVGHDLFAEWVPTNVVPGVAGAAPTLLDAEVRFWIDGHLVAKHEMRGALQITIATTEEMNFGVMGNNITDIASASVDYLKCEQVR